MAFHRLWSYDSSLTATFSHRLGFIVPDDSLQKQCATTISRAFSRAVQLDFFLDVLPREGKGMEKLYISDTILIDTYLI